MQLTEKVINMRDGLTKTLGITYHSTPEPDTLEAHMTCTQASAQPWGYLSGGATLALAENLAGVASMCLSPDRAILGINIMANHISTVKIGETVIATAKLIRKGGTLHNWIVTVRNEEGGIVSEVQVTNYTLPEKKVDTRVDIQRLDGYVLDASAVPTLMQQHGVQYRKIKHANWNEEFPYTPEVEVGIAHNDAELLLHFRVNEQSVRAVAEKDQDNVWEDSCVEFFSQPNPIDGIYYNLECNCTGKVLLAAGATREGRERAPKEVTDKIKRWASLGTTPFAERREQTAWEVALVIPKSVYFKHNIETLQGLRIKANAYKCGDKLTTPHFLSLFPISTPSPDFHRPDFFNSMMLG